MARRKKPTSKVDRRLVQDRMNFLKMNAGNKVLPSHKAAKAFAAQQLSENGLVYAVNGKQRTAKLARVDFDAVRASISMKIIRDDLRLSSRSSRGRKARALEALGRRENFFDWPVGETPH